MVQKLFPADDKLLEEVLLFVEEELNKAGALNKTVMQVKICVEEIFVNVAHYAYKDEVGDVLISISFDEEERTMTFGFEDGGIRYNPLEKEDPDITLTAEERRIGGLGVYICKKTMDDIRYEYVNNKNVLKMTKKL
ncbi:MAG: ATP-binding protein [Lachnospiraceae bacterium]|nr:ATP-binding protein [Lachnospiraceae bacterium]